MNQKVTTTSVDEATAKEIESTSVQERVSKVKESWKDLGADFVGSEVWLSVRLNRKVDLKDIRNAIINDPVVPDEWAPEMMNELSAYNQIVTSLERKGLKEFEKYSGDIPFNKEDHAGYHIERLDLTKDNKIPRKDKVFRIVKDVTPVRDEKGEIVDKKIKDVKVDEGVRVWIVRSNHEDVGPEGDETGESQWKVRIITEEGDEIPDDYWPYYATLCKKFEEKKNQIYDSTQVRDLILNNMLLDEDRLDAVSINRGIYFVPESDIEKLEALRDLFYNIDPGILLHITHIPYFEDNEALNRNFRNVQHGVFESLQEEVEDLKEELKHHHESDKNTRKSTFIKRQQDLFDLKTKLQEFKNKKLFELELVDDDLREMEDILDEHIHDDEEE